MTPHAIRVFDGVLDDPDTYRSAALLCHFEDVPVGNGVVFHGMAGIGHSPLAALIESTFPALQTTYEAFRLSPEGQDEPSFVHTDRDMGDWTAIYYLNPEPPAGDGTTFWKHRETGDIQSTQPDPTFEALLWNDRSLWEPWHLVEARFNRLLLFPSPYFHSRAMFENWGTGTDARLIQLCFGNGVLPCV